MTGVDATLLLTNRVAPVDAEPLKAKEFWALRAEIDPAELFGASAADLGQRLGDPGLAERVVTLLDAATGFALAREELESKGVRMLAPGDGTYPERLVSTLGDAAPPMLYVAGPTEWLDVALIGVVGSRDVDDDGAEVARGVAAIAAKAGAGIVSGGANGVDLISMNAAHEAGIPSVGVTAEGLVRASSRKELRGAVSEQRLLLVSPFAPGAGFNIGNAMGRNKLIYALASTTLVIASDLDSGGTWAGATEALRRRFGAVAVWAGAGSGLGNATLVDKGGVAVHDIDGWDPLSMTAPDPPPETSQLGLGI